MTQYDFCIKCHISLANYHKKLNNPEEFRIRELNRIAQVLKIPLKVLIFSEIVFKEF